MTDREIVISGLEHCSNKSFCNDGCPYSPILKDANFGIDECITQLAHDALELLEEQEPRVLSYEQIKGIVEGVVWVELNWRETVEPWIVHQGRIWRPDYNVGYEHWDVSQEDEYNMIVRCWTAKPSYEQRKAVKWDG